MSGALASQAFKSSAKTANSVDSLATRLHEHDDHVLSELMWLVAATEFTHDISPVMRHKKVVCGMAEYYMHEKADVAQKTSIVNILGAIIKYNYKSIVADNALYVLFNALKQNEAGLIIAATKPLQRLLSVVVSGDECDTERAGGEGGVLVRVKLIESGAVNHLLHLVQSVRDNEELLYAAILALKKYMKSSPAIRHVVLVKGGVGPITEIFQSEPQGSKLTLATAYMIGSLMWENDSEKEVSLSNGVFDRFVDWFVNGNKEMASTAAWYLGCMSELFEKGQEKVTAAKGLLEKLLNVLEQDLHTKYFLDLLVCLSGHPDAKKNLPTDRMEALLAPILKENVEGTLGTSKNILQNNICTMVAIILANIIDCDTKKDVLKVDEALLGYLNKTINKTIDGHRYWALHTLVRVVTNLTVNDENKRSIKDSGIIKTLVRILQMKKEDIRELNTQPKGGNQADTKGLVAQALWNLAFNDDCKKIIKETEYALDVLKKLSNNRKATPLLRKNATGALWLLGESDVSKSDVTSAVAQQQEVSNEHGPHIMISYCWAQQPMVKQISASLKAAGYRVWLDVEQMAGSTLEAMASAVERSAAVLVCMSRRYKESPNCRLEGEYTSNLRKEYIPLMMENNFRPDGWLGIMLGSKLWYDFRTEDSFDSALEAVIKQLGPRGKDQVTGAATTITTTTTTTTTTAASTVTTPTVVSVESSLSPLSLSSLLLWKEADVKSWLEKIELPDYIPVFAHNKIKGVALAELSTLSIQHPKLVFGFLKEWGGPTMHTTQHIELVFHMSKLPQK